MLNPPDINNRRLPEDSGWEFGHCRVEMNVEANRIQIFFDSKPDEDTYTAKSLNGGVSSGHQVWEFGKDILMVTGLYAVKQVKSIQPIERETKL